jgi:UDP-GlcNAc:undecaprenyl-phosphate GlcNAc-1-phosphate transferase
LGRGLRCAQPGLAHATMAFTEFVRQWSPAAVAAVVAWAVLGLLLRHAERLPVDQPNARSLHARPVPRAGGAAIWAGWLAGVAWTAGPKPWLLPLLALIAISVLDDRRPINPAIRLGVHFAAAALWLWLAAPEINFVAAMFAIVWMANLYNFMDGSDGLAGVMTVVGFGGYAVAAAEAGADDAVLFLALASAAVPFLARNLPPARVFLGDAGAVPLGFLAAVFGIAGWEAAWWPLWFPVLVFLPFIADATLTLASRLLHRDRIWEAHREHYYQRLVRLGWGHGGTLKLHAVLMLGAAASAVAAVRWAPQSGPALLAAWGAILGIVYSVIGYHWRRRRNKGINESKG